MLKFTKISFIFILTTFIISCSSENNSPNPEQEISNPSELNAKEIAQYHNIAVELYENSSYKRQEGKQDILEIQEAVYELLLENNPELMKTYDFDLIKEKSFLQKSYVKSENSFDFNSFLNESLDTLVKANQITKSFGEKIKNITLSDDNYLNKIDELSEMRKFSNNEKEIQFIDIYKETLKASNDYWNNSNRAQLKLECSSGVIASDAVGAALGLFGGPLLSIVQGAVVSIAVNEDC